MDMHKGTMVDVGGKKISLEVLARSFPAMGLGAPAIPEAPKAGGKRRIVSPAPAAPATVTAPTAASTLGKAIAALKPAAGPVSSIVEAPKAQKTYPGVAIGITKELVVVKEGEAPVEMLVLAKRAVADGTTKVKGKKLAKGTAYSHYNYAFDTGFCHYATKGAETPKPTWKWNDERQVRFIPVSEIETLLDGLRRYYTGATLVIEGQAPITL